MSQLSVARLHQFLLDHFNIEELKDLCLNLFVEYEDLGGEARKDKARELVLLMKRHGKLDHFGAILAQARPAAYREAFQSPAPVPPLPVGKPLRNPRQVFVSHAHQDAEFAQRLAADLRRNGHPVWIAPDSILIGEDWPDAIDRGLDESGVIVVALTSHALASYWVRKETSTARILEAHKHIRFILLDVADCDPPSAWKTYQYAPFRDNYQAGLHALLHWLDGEPAPVRPPVETGRRPVSTPTTNRRIHAKTGIELIRIPAGPFLYGSADSDTMAFDDEKPQRTIDLPEYWIGRYPVTNAQFARFVQATDYRTAAEAQGFGWGWTGSKWDQIKGADWRHPRGPGSSIDNKDDHPVVQVSWDDAQAFCDWAGLILPSEQQWEKAARGADGRLWPWGDEPPTDRHCNFNMNVKDTTPVGRYSPLGDSPYGCVDMAGNVWDWTGSWYEKDKTRALRGGSWSFYVQYSRVACRDHYIPNDRGGYIGFRVAELLSDPDS
jgi:formylglycine-generating enzyme